MKNIIKGCIETINMQPRGKNRFRAPMSVVQCNNHILKAKRMNKTHARSARCLKVHSEKALGGRFNTYIRESSMTRVVLCPNCLTYFKPHTLKTEIKIFASMYVINEL